MSAVISVFSTVLLSPFVAGITYVITRGINFKINK